MMDFGGKFLNVLLFMRSWPGDLLFLSFLTIDRSSPGGEGARLVVPWAETMRWIDQFEECK